MNWLAAVPLAIAACGCGYAVLATALLQRFDREVDPPPKSLPAVTLLKPLCGDEAGLYERLVTFCRQAYEAPVQLLFGVQDVNDAAIPIVRRLIEEHPHGDIELVVGEAGWANPKVANLEALHTKIRHDVVIVSDSDVIVSSDYIAGTIAVLERCGVGAVTCLYHGVADSSMPARLSSMAIDYFFLPNVVAGVALGLARPCFGSTIALRLATLEAVGGFAAFRDQLADDYGMGEAVRALGLKVAIAPFLVSHRCTDKSIRELLRHEIRWARTIRAVSAAGYAGSIIAYPLPFAMLGAMASDSATVGILAVLVAIGCRLALQARIDTTLNVSRARWCLGPIRELLAFSVHIIAFFVNVVSWRGKRFRVRADGTLVPLRASIR